ncbi:MAG: acetyltransferase [Idiomarina sp.]|nr:MAG: acetyltransferase [Idiomarina sp.]
MYVDVFNGDADGIFSLIQLRKVFPVDAASQVLISGVKRDNALLARVSDEQARDAVVHALDISFDKNTDDLRRILSQGASVFYCDHHQARTLFEHERLQCLIDFAPTVCTGLLMNSYLEGRQRLWAVAAAFGDSLNHVAETECAALGLSAAEVSALRELGVLVNYNGYGASVDDLHYAPEDLFRALMVYDSPLAAVADSAADAPFAVLRRGFAEDMALAAAADVVACDDVVRAVMLPAEAWARRISGTLGNDLAHANPSQAIVIATPNADGATLTVSLRAPKVRLEGAGDICARFDGGGRAGAGGVNALPVDALDEFVGAVRAFYK